MTRFPLGLLLRSKWFVFLLISLAILIWLAVREFIGIGSGTYPAYAALLWLFFLGMVVYLIVHHLSNFHAVANVMGEETEHAADYAERLLRAEERRTGGRHNDSNNWL